MSSMVPSGIVRPRAAPAYGSSEPKVRPSEASTNLPADVVLEPLEPFRCWSCSSLTPCWRPARGHRRPCRSRRGRARGPARCAPRSSWRARATSPSRQAAVSSAWWVTSNRVRQSCSAMACRHSVEMPSRAVGVAQLRAAAEPDEVAVVAVAGVEELRRGSASRCGHDRGQPLRRSRRAPPGRRPAMCPTHASATPSSITHRAPNSSSASSTVSGVGR